MIPDAKLYAESPLRTYVVPRFDDRTDVRSMVVRIPEGLVRGSSNVLGMNAVLVLEMEGERWSVFLDDAKVVTFANNYVFDQADVEAELRKRMNWQIGSGKRAAPVGWLVSDASAADSGAS